jgi:uncharacterized integral membrane protein (TIGR00701 family)
MLQRKVYTIIKSISTDISTLEIVRRGWAIGIYGCRQLYRQFQPRAAVTARSIQATACLAEPDSRYGWFASGWLWAKIILVLALSAVHGLLARWRKDFAQDRNRHSQKFYRIINEVPTVLMILIVLLVVLKPF